jgi:TPR repeat protein
MYMKGHGVPQNNVRAYMWLSIADADGTLVADRSRDIVAKRMTPAQIAEAEKLAWEWIAKHSK